MNNNTTAANQIVEKIPPVVFFNNLQKDRYKVLSYLDYLFQNVPESQSINFDLLARAVIAKHLRVSSMKVVEYEVLLLVALQNITLDDLSLDTKSLVMKLMQENPDKTDLDKMNRVLAQIMTKLPIDIRESVTGIQKVQIFQLLSKNIKMDPKLVENFINYNPSLNKDYMFTMEIDKGNYDTLNKKFIQEMKAYTERAPYVSAQDMEYLNVATKLQNLMEKNKIANNKLNASYINTSPVLMTGATDDQLYYFDESSGTLSPIQVYSNQVPITTKELEQLLISHKVSKDQIDELIASSRDTSFTSSLTNLVRKYFGSSGSNNNVGGNNISGGNNGSSYNSTSKSTSTSVDKPLIPDFIKKAFASNLLSGSGTSSTLSDSKQDVLNYSALSNDANYTYGSEYNTGYKSELSKSIDANILANIFDYLAMGYPLFNSSTTTTKASTTTTTTTKAAGGSTSTTLPATATTPPVTATTPPATTLPATTLPATTLPATTLPATTVANLAGFRNMSESNNNELTQEEENLLQKLKKKNETVENTALYFVVIIVLLFLLVIFNAYRSKGGKK